MPVNGISGLMLLNGTYLMGVGANGSTIYNIVGIDANNNCVISVPLSYINQNLTPATLLGTLLLPTGSMLLPVSINGVTYNITLTKA